ncbi:hypothetical protein PsorP6_015151 [Peronosclerospora sorghi]|uniref:Uncharacterized protein n=1 Tax=Peronosclerospora sorghi TaxID=230839 RepID=A0ACC0VTR0_9STRA|nr:hypothetical protein PsorP6_015151 [Peronosclerospora sorghi]
MYKMPKRYLGQREAQLLDEKLMSHAHGFSIDQLMELAGLSVAAAITKEYPSTAIPSKEFKRVFVVAGPGNNGGDALVAARHLVVSSWQHFGYLPSIFYPKRSTKPSIQVKLGCRLVTQCEQLNISFLEDIQDAYGNGYICLGYANLDNVYDFIVDGIFGFSFSGTIRPPFDRVVRTLQKCQTPIVSIDIPSGWHVENGTLWFLADHFSHHSCNQIFALIGNEGGVGLEPHMLISLTAPKICARYFTGADKSHYVVAPQQLTSVRCRSLAREFDLELPEYPGAEQCVKLPIPY